MSDQQSLTWVADALHLIAKGSDEEVKTFLIAPCSNFTREKILMTALACAIAEAIRDMASPATLPPDAMLALRFDDCDDATELSGLRQASALVSLAFEHDHESMATIIDRLLGPDSSTKDIEVGAVVMVSLTGIWRQVAPRLEQYLTQQNY